MMAAEWREATRSIAEQLGYDPNIAEQVFQAESSYNPSAKSSKGAYGISQMMPGTWDIVSKQTGLNDRNNPFHQIINGIYYLKDVTSQVGGNPILGVAAYNAGPGAVKKYNGVPPYSKTMNYVKKIFGNLAKMAGPSEAEAAEIPQQAPSEGQRDWAADIFGQAAPTQQQPTGGPTDGMQREQRQEGTQGQGGQVDWAAAVLTPSKPGEKTIRDMPEKPVGTPGLSFATMSKAGLVDNPKTKAEIFAREQFPNEPVEKAMKRYFQRGGEWYFIDNDGQAYPVKGKEETGYDPGAMARRIGAGAKEIGADIVGKGPIIAGSTAGLAAGTAVGHPYLGSNLGAAAGAAARKVIGTTLLDEPPETPGQFATGVGKEVAANTGGLLLGSGLTKLGNKALTTGRGIVAPALQNELGRFNPAEIAQRVADYQRAGITPTLAEIFDSPSLENLFALGQKTAGPAAEQIRQWARETRIPQLNEAIENALLKMSPETSVYGAGARGVSAAQRAKKGLEGAREGLAGPYYKAAETGGTKIDTSSVLSLIDDDILAQYQPTSTVSQEVSRIRKLMVSSTTDANGKPIEVPELSFLAADNAKKEIDALLKGEKRTAINKDVKNKLMEIKGSLTKSADEAIPDYNVARGVYSEASIPINEFETGVGVQDPTRLGKYSESFLNQIEKATGFKAEEIPGKMFSRKMSVEDIKLARKYIEAEDPDAWKAMVSGGLRDKWNQLKDTQAGTDIGYRWKKAVFATKDDAERLRAMTTPDQFRDLESLFKVLDQTERVVYSNSMTEPLAETNRIAKIASGGKFARWMSQYGTISPQRIGQSIQQLTYPGYMDKMTRAILTADPAAIEALATVRRIPYGVDRAIAVSAMITGILEGAEMTGTSEWYPEQVGETGKSGLEQGRRRTKDLLKK